MVIIVLIIKVPLTCKIITAYFKKAFQNKEEWHISFWNFFFFFIFEILILIFWNYAN